MHNLISLSAYLKNHGLLEESFQIIQLAQINLKPWQEIISIINTPVPDQILTATKYISQGIIGMQQNAEKLKQLPAEDLKLLAQISSQQANSHQLKTAQLKIIKDLGAKGLRLMPLIGFMFSFLIALKNFMYGFATFAKLAKDSSQIELNWFEILFPNKLNEKIDQYQDDPKHLKIVTQLTKYSKEFSDEIISLVANSLDFIKDIIFIFIDVGSFGWMTVGDISLSFILMGLEMLVEANVLPQFDQLLTKIGDIAKQHLQQTSSEIDSDFFDLDSQDEEIDYDLFK